MYTKHNIKKIIKSLITIGVLASFMLTTPTANAQVQSEQEMEFIMTLKELAWENYPNFQWYDLEVERMGVLMRQRRLEMIEAITFGYNFAGFASDDNLNPIVGLGVSVNLGRFFYTGARVQDARIMRRQARVQKDVERVQIAMEVFDRYAFYKRALELTEIQSEAVAENRQTMFFLKRQFEEGEIPLLEYQRASDAYMETMRVFITYKNDLMKGKLELEQLVGKRLEEI